MSTGNHNACFCFVLFFVCLFFFWGGGGGWGGGGTEAGLMGHITWLGQSKLWRQNASYTCLG